MVEDYTIEETIRVLGELFEKIKKILKPLEELLEEFAPKSEGANVRVEIRRKINVLRAVVTAAMIYAADGIVEKVEEVGDEISISEKFFIASALALDVFSSVLTITRKTMEFIGMRYLDGVMGQMNG